MAYTTKDATATLFEYLNIQETEVQFIEDTSKRGFIFENNENGEKSVVFIYPISHKSDDSKNFFDTRDSGAYERGVAWNYALTHKIKYFCFAVHSQVERYKNYIFSLECNERTIEKVSGTVNGVRAGKGTQVVIPNDYAPNKMFERILTKNGFFISAVHRDYIMDYIKSYDNRPYLLDNELIDINESANVNPTIDKLMSLDNKEFIFSCLDLMKNNKLFNDHTLSILQSKKECAVKFLHNSANGILYKIDNHKTTDEQNEQRKDSDGKSRYYSDRYQIGDDEYFVSSEWRKVTEDDNPRQPLIDWIKFLMNGLIFDTDCKKDFPYNRILFGAPGTGKSYQLKKDCKDFLKDTTGAFERVTFHPDYTYSQFVGTYKPVSNEKGIDYTFVPGPFMRVYVEAMKNARTSNPQPYILIIEEINRAKVAAVFGDVFQLLDRNDRGISEYEIQTSKDIREHLAKELECDIDQCKKMQLPNNMFIWATMNSADQGVFPMDTAFKRRWNFEYLGINENQSEIKGSFVIENSEPSRIEWNVLRRAINEKLAKEYKVNEDKLMGPFFLSKQIVKTVSNEDDTIADNKRFIAAFKSKVIMYLYEDAAKQQKHKLFSGCEDTTKYSAVCDSFDEIGIRIFGDDFEEKYYNPQRG